MCLATTAYVYTQLRSTHIFLVQFNNSDRFQIYGVTDSYSSRPFLYALNVYNISSFPGSEEEPGNKAIKDIHTHWFLVRDPVNMHIYR